METDSFQYYTENINVILLRLNGELKFINSKKKNLDLKSLMFSLFPSVRSKLNIFLFWQKEKILNVNFWILVLFLNKSWEGRELVIMPRYLTVCAWKLITFVESREENLTFKTRFMLKKKNRQNCQLEEFR